MNDRARSIRRAVTGMEPAGSVAAESMDWHGLGAEEVLDRLASDRAGLTGAEAASRLDRFGENTLLLSAPTPWWRILARQQRSPIVALLAVAAIGAWLVGDRLEGLAIAAVLVLNSALAFGMEMWSRQVMEALRRLEVQRAMVRRDGRTEWIDSRGLVPGDIVLFAAGEAIPADARLLSVAELQVIEAPLTGEAAPVAKSTVEVLSGDAEGDVPLADRRSMVFKGTLAAAGSAEAVVVATGAATEIGRIAQLVVETPETRSPLERRLDALGRRLVWIALAIAIVVAALGILRTGEWWLMIETGLALAIAAIPEGLPVVATITLALGMRRMARRQALVRRLSAVETLGSATVVCADKTGTLTAGEMTVVEYRLPGRAVEVTGAGLRPEGGFVAAGERFDPLADPALELALRVGILANHATVPPSSPTTRENGGVRAPAAGDPTEVALLVSGLKAGLDRGELLRRYPEVARVPFSSERMLMATFHRAPAGGRLLCLKGAPDRLLELSETMAVGAERRAVTEQDRHEILGANRRMAERGLRVLALACRDLVGDEPVGEAALRELTFIGLVGIADPPASGVGETVRRLGEAGVRTVMITGDQAMTALAVGRQLGLVASQEQVFEGSLAADEPDGWLDRRLDRIGVFSRVSPVDKLRIVEAFQRRGEIVAMLGDGVNDAPALKRADIGVAMGGRGTDVAKETAALVLRDDRFETLLVAVREGRIIFDNIRKFVFYLFSCNLAEVLVLFVAGLAGLPLPLLPLQLLWLNLVTDVFPALALAAEPAEPGVMKRPPRDPRSAILSRAFIQLTALHASILATATLSVYLFALLVWRTGEQRAGTLAFMTLALSQLLHVFNARSERAVLFSRRVASNGWIWAALALTVTLQLSAIYEPGLAAVLGTTRMALDDWLLVLAGSLLPLVVGQLWKVLRSAK